MAARRLRVLFAEKRISGAGLMVRAMCAEAGWDLELVFVGAKEEIGAAMAAHCPDVALLDLTLLQPDAPSFVSVLNRANRSVPIILYAESADKDNAANCLGMGAKDYLLEGFLDERTVALVLRSAVREAEERDGADLECSDGCKPSKCKENVGKARSRDGSSAEDGMRSKLLGVLKKNVRERDKIVPRWCGQIDLVLADTNENCLGPIIKRLRERVEACFEPSMIPLSALVMVRAGRGEILSRPLMGGASRCAEGKAGAVTPLAQGIEERP